MLTTLRYKRLAKGLKINEMAQAVGIHETLLSKIELRQSYCPPKWREKLANFLEVTTDEIFDEHGMATLMPK
jgi:transcriptional regulator with XRE-family HTH domain